MLCYVLGYLLVVLPNVCVCAPYLSGIILLVSRWDRLYYTPALRILRVVLLSFPQPL